MPFIDGLYNPGFVKAIINKWRGEPLFLISI